MRTGWCAHEKNDNATGGRHSRAGGSKAGEGVNNSGRGQDGVVVVETTTRSWMHGAAGMMAQWRMVSHGGWIASEQCFRQWRARSEWHGRKSNNNSV